MNLKMDDRSTFQCRLCGMEWKSNVPATCPRCADISFLSTPGDTHRNGGDWFQTHTGKKFYPRDPRIEDIDIRDIARALSNICRFGGHVNHFYSVAQHSVLVSRIVNAEHRMMGLLHDAAEAYVGDMVRPLKRSLPEYQAIELRIEQLIAEKFKLKHPWDNHIKWADNVALMTERRDVLQHQIPGWAESAEPCAMRILAWTPEQAERMFLARYDEIR